MQGGDVGPQRLPRGRLIQHEGRRLGDVERVLRYAHAAERHDGQRRRFRDPARDGQIHAVLDQLFGEQVAERVGGEAAQETGGLT